MDTHKTKILYVITKSNFGGAQRNLYELATGIPKETFEVSAAFGGSGILKTKLEAEGIVTYAIPSFERDISLFKELKAMVELAQIIRKVHPNIVHLHSSKAGGSGAFVARLCGVKKIIFTAHGWPFFEDRSLLWRALAWFFSYLTTLLVHTVIVVSQNDFKNHHMPLVTRKIKLIYNAVPEIVFKERVVARQFLFTEEELARHARDCFAVTTSEHTANKNLFMLLRALGIHNSTASKKIFLTLMHEGEDTEKLRRFVQKNKLSDFVKFTGYIDEARTYLSAFDLFVLPSLKEGLPYGLLEAGMACLPCIASNVGGIPEVIEHGKTGILFNSHNEHSLVEALSTLALNEEKRHAYGATLHGKIITDFSLPTMLEKTQALY